MNAHVSAILLGVNDMEKAKRFYMEGLGWKIPTATSGRSVTARKAAISHTRSSGGAKRGKEVFYEPEEGHAEVRQEHDRERQDVQRTDGRGTRRAERDDRRAESGREQGGE